MKKTFTILCVILLFIPFLPNTVTADASPPKPIEITGEITVSVNEDNSYTVNTGVITQDHYIRFLWGDNTSSSWLGPENETAIYVGIDHFWNKSGIYSVVAQISYYSDGRNASESEPLTVFVGYLKMNRHSSKYFAKIDIENCADKYIEDITWNVTVKPINKALLFTSGEISNSFTYIGIGKEKTINSGLVFGFGYINITVSVYSPTIGKTITKIFPAFLLFFNVI